MHSGPRVVPLATVIFCALHGMAAALPAPLPAETDSEPAPLSAGQVAARLEERNRQRAMALHQLEGARLYHLEYHGPGGDKQAEMRVRMNFRAPSDKQLTVISQQGSRLIIDHVFAKLLQAEQEAVREENRRASDLTQENYAFSLEGLDRHEGGDAYVLGVLPRTKNKFLYRGRIWVNANDFAVMRIEAAPARNPSFWVKKTEIQHQYVKVGDFWLPERSRTESQIRFGGRAILTIDYEDYKIVSAAPLPISEQAGNAW